MNQDLINAWLEAKEAERSWAERRREIEDAMTSDLGISETDSGQKTVTEGRFKVKVTHRHTQSVNAAQLQEIAASGAVTNEQLSSWFRWKPEINQAAFKAAGDATKAVLSAITTKPSRPSYSIEIQE